MKYILGIDPGFSGALAIYDPIEHYVLAVQDMPLIVPAADATSIMASHSRRSNIDPAKLASFVLTHSKLIRIAVLERVNAAPDQGVVSMFRFGEGFGMIQGVLATIGIRTILPMPAVWKASMAVTADKNSSISKCRYSFGDKFMAEKCPLKKHHGRCEAILLAMFGAKSLGITKTTDKTVGLLG